MKDKSNGVVLGCTPLVNRSPGISPYSSRLVEWIFFLTRFGQVSLLQVDCVYLPPSRPRGGGGGRMCVSCHETPKRHFVKKIKVERTCKLFREREREREISECVQSRGLKSFIFLFYLFIHLFYERAGRDVFCSGWVREKQCSLFFPFNWNDK